MSEHKLLAYVGNDSQSAQLVQLYKQLPVNHQRIIGVVNFAVLAQSGHAIPDYLSADALPALVTNEVNPSVRVGHQAVQTMATYVRNCRAPPPQAPAPPGAAAQMASAYGGAPGEQRPMMAPPPSGAGHNGAKMGLSGSDEVAVYDQDAGVSGISASVVTDDLYYSYMPVAHGGAPSGGSGKITSTDISRFNSQRESSEAVQARARMRNRR